MPLQRAMTDFGADHAFGQVPKKLHEHYGIEMPVSTIRKITEFHGEQMHQQRETMTLSLTTPGCQQQIGEIDGCMLPIVTIGEKEGDKRKQKKLHWQEARLALVHEQGSVTPKFDATFGGSVNDAGQALLNCAVAAGFGTQTHLHGVGDGALWIADQTNAKFGAQASYLADFFHVCEYLAAASKKSITRPSIAGRYRWLKPQCQSFEKSLISAFPTYCPRLLKSVSTPVCQGHIRLSPELLPAIHPDSFCLSRLNNRLHADS